MRREIKTGQNIVHIGQSTNDILNAILKEKYADSKKLIITDDNVFELWIEQLVTSVPELSEAEIIQLPAGEGSKCIEIATQVWESLSENKIERTDLLINFGGGMITDVGGFIASLYKRGIPFINIPTSLLAQVDASVGGKTGIDLGSLKNQIGLFSQAKSVLINPNYLSTLTKEELYSGYAEMLKHGLIKSKQHWIDLKSIDFDKVENLTGLIYDSVSIKNNIVLADPREESIRKALNYGHTIGHSLEGHLLNSDNPIKHGHAVALGMLAEGYISFKLGFLAKEDWEEIQYIITDIFEQIKIDSVLFPQLIRLMENDKKNKAGKINFTLLTGIGSHIINQEVSRAVIMDALDFTFT